MMVAILPVGLGLSPVPPAPVAPETFGIGTPTTTAGVGGAGVGPGAITKGFGDLLGQAIDAVNGTQAQADAATQDLVLGKSQDIHAVMIAIEKAKITFDLAVQVRNKSLDAYNEMMRLQV